MNGEAWTDDAFEAPLAESPLPPVDPIRVPLALSLISMVLVLVSFLVPLFGSWLTLHVAGMALSRLARIRVKERRRIPRHLRRRVRIRAVTASIFAGLFAVLWFGYLLR